ncbi:MAG: zf-HC2 domain-containing protein, partial [Planctomycetota bacterium]
MDCEEVAEFLEDFHAGDESLKQNRDVVAHLKECETCRGSLQSILFDLDMAMYTAFFEEMESPKGSVDKVLDALPGSARKAVAGRKGKGRRKPPSSSRLGPVRGDRKKGPRKGRTSGIGGPKAMRRTTTLRRRDKDQSGLFLQDQIFGSTEKKTGLIITYCEECGERIDPDDFETGAAIHHQNASYCQKCKESVVGAVTEPAKPKTGARKAAKTKARSAPRPQPARPPSGRMAAPAKKGMNLPLVGGGLMGAAVLILVAVVIVISLGNGDTEGERIKEKKKVTNVESGQDKDGSETETKVEETKSSAMEDETKLFKKIEEEKQKMKEEAARRKRLPMDKLNAWRAEAEKIIETKGFDAAIQFWNRIYSNLTEDKIYDPKDMKEKPIPEKVTKRGQEAVEGWIEKNWRKVEFNDEQKATVPAELRKVRERQERSYGKDLEKRVAEIMALVEEAKFDEARKKADEIPEDWEVKFPKGVQKLRGIRRDIDLWERNWKRKKAAELQQKACREISAGAWVDLIRETEEIAAKDDLAANWSQSGKVELEKDNKTWTVTLRGGNSYIFSKH